jgi:hypothetical protein
MILGDFKGFCGQHCETTATGSLLNSIGLRMSEPVLFGLGEGLSYVIQEPVIHDIPFMGGRIPEDTLTKNICTNLNLDLTLRETSSSEKAWRNVKRYLDEGTPVGLKLDCYYLEYFEDKYHFAAHCVAIYGYDDTYGYLVDTMQQGRYVKSKLENIQRARNERGPMSSRNLSYTINSSNNPLNLEDAVGTALQNNARKYLNPHTDNVGFNGINRTAEEVERWYARSQNVTRDFKTAAVMMERAGTGGALFRNLYRDFLYHAHIILGDERIKQAHQRFIHIARMWTNVSGLFDQLGTRRDRALLKPIVETLHELADRESETMELLARIS